MSANQKRKIEDRRIKLEEEAKAKKDAEQKVKLAREKKEAEERARKQKEIFEGLAAAKEKSQNQTKTVNQSNFMDIMNEQDVDSKKKKAQEEARFKKMNANQDKGLSFNYLGAGQKHVSKETLAGTVP